MESKKGGKRLGAGRKPVLNKKKQVTLYVENNKILPFGGEDKMKDHLYGVIDGFGQPVQAIQDLTRPTNEIKPFEQPKTNYEVKVTPQPITSVMGNYEALKSKVLKTTTIKEIEAVMREVKASLLYPKEKLSLEAIAKEHSKAFFND